MIAETADKCFIDHIASNLIPEVRQACSLSRRSVLVFCVRSFADLLNQLHESSSGERLERATNKKGLENALLQCHKVIETFQGSEETLRHIRHVEESLRRLIVETD